MMRNLFLPGHTLGIVGGGHQGRLLALAAKNIGLKVGVLDPDKYCPATDIVDWHILASETDEAGLISLAEKSDMITFTCETVDLTVLKRLQHEVTLPQSFELLELSQNRLLSKRYFEESNINIAPYQLIGDSADLDLAIESIGLPGIVKPIHHMSRKQQSYQVKTMTDIRHLVEPLGTGPCLLESMIDYERLIAVSVVGNGSGEFEVLPIVDLRTNKYGHFQRAVVPAAITLDVALEIERLAEKIATDLKVRGMLTIEMFVTEIGIIYVNTLHHGPHVGYDYTLNHGSYSQYEAHLRGLLGWPLPTFEQSKRCVSLPVKQEQLSQLLTVIPSQKEWYYHLDRPTLRQNEDIVGHVNIVTNDLSQALEAIQQTEIWE